MEEDAFCLRLFDSLPDLLALAKKGLPDRRMGGHVSVYPLQDKLREQYQRRGMASRWSMPLRHYGPCQQCDERFTEMLYRLENPKGVLEETHKLCLRESQIHAVRVHGGEFMETQRAFLKGLSLSDGVTGWG